jgi:N-acetylgalactosamine-N,N'-diacetylbacillosaminyl-diphospho-undecaprenol 4-alpha-N-acetylgalactosaminyltransferase
MQWKRVFITTGRLISSKHHAKIISALKMVYDKLDKNWIFLILSDWPQRKILEQQVSDLWLKKHIYFLGLQKNVFKYLYAADWFLYASEVEWFPNVLIEAMACNLFILTSHFKTWAEECILWHYKNSINTEIKYPYYGPNGVLFDLLNYENDFFEVYKHLDSIKKEKKGFEKFDIQKICTQILAFMC